MGGIADLDAAGEAIKLDTLNLDPGVDALLSQPTGQDLLCGGPAIDIEAGDQD